MAESSTPRRDFAVNITRVRCLSDPCADGRSEHAYAAGTEPDGARLSLGLCLLFAHTLKKESRHRERPGESRKYFVGEEM